MKLTAIRIAGISSLFCLTFISAVTAAAPREDETHPAFERQRGHAHGITDGRLGHRRSPATLLQIERIDGDADGQINADEFVDFRIAHLEKQFSRLDRNEDGLLNLGETQRPARPDRPGRQQQDATACVRAAQVDFGPVDDMDLAEHFASVDTDGNELLSLTEASIAREQRARELFGRIDTDADNFITEIELKAWRQTQLDARVEFRSCMRALGKN